MKVGLLGYGTVGGGVAEILQGGVEGLELKRILRRKYQQEQIFTQRAEDIIGDGEIDVVVEAIGGFEPAYTYIKQALINGKHVVTANKEVVAKSLAELTRLAEENGVRFMYEASCGGGIPFLKTLSTLSAFNGVKAVKGILNGTVNYILSLMQEGESFDVALKKAQDEGFAEADPSADINGDDSVRKLTIISSLAYHTVIDAEWVNKRGIVGITPEFMVFLRDKGYLLKYIAHSAITEDGVELHVEPCAVSTDSAFAGVNREFNGVEIDAYPNGRLFFSGQGAGRYPTASAIIADLVEISRGAAGMAFNPVKQIKPSKTHKNGRFYLQTMGGSVVEADENAVQNADGFYCRILD